MPEEIGKGILSVGFDSAQVEQAGKEQLLPSAKRLATDIAGAFAAIKIAGFLNEGIEELKGAQVVSAQTAAQLKATGEAAGITAAQIDELGQSMLDLAGFDDEAARSAVNVLLRFDQLKGFDLFKRIEADAADLAITMGTDLTSSAELLGKALQSPDKAARLLKPVIGALTDEQTKAIEKFLALNDVAGAQGVILDALEAKIGGTAAAYGETLTASISRSTEEWKNAKAALVEGFAPALQLGADLSTKFATAISGAPEGVQALVGGIVLLGGTVGPLLGGIGSLATTYGTLTARSAAAAAATAVSATAAEAEAVAQTADAAATGANAAAHGGLSTASKVFIGVVGVAAVGALYAYGKSLNKTSLDAEELADITKLSSDQIIDGFNDLAAKAKGPFAHIFDDTLTGLIDQGPAGIGVLRQMRDHYAEIGDSEHLGKVDAALNKAAEAEKNLSENVERGTSSLEGNEEALAAVGKAADGFAGFMDGLSAAIDEAYQASGRFDQATLDNVDAVAAYEGSVDSLTDTLKENGNTLDLHEQKGRDNYAALRDSGNAIKDLIQLHFDETGSIQTAVEWGGKYVQNLRDQLAAAGYNEEQIAEMVDQINLTPEDIITTFTSNAAQQQLVIAEYTKLLDDEHIPPEVRTDIKTLIAQGDYEAASAKLDDLAAGRTVTLTVDIDTSEYQQYLAIPGFEGKAAGGGVGPGQLFRGAEDGWEIMFRDGLYQAPPSGGWVMPHAQSEQYLASAMSGMGGGAPVYQLTSGPVYVREPQDVVTGLRRVELMSGVL